MADGHPLDVCMREEEVKERTLGGDGLVMNSSSAFDSPYHNAPDWCVSYCTLLNVIWINVVLFE